MDAVENKAKLAAIKYRRSTPNEMYGDELGFLAGVEWQIQQQDEFVIGFVEWIFGRDVNDEESLTIKKHLQIYKS